MNQKMHLFRRSFGILTQSKICWTSSAEQDSASQQRPSSPSRFNSLHSRLIQGLKLSIYKLVNNIGGTRHLLFGVAVGQRKQFCRPPVPSNTTLDRPPFRLNMVTLPAQSDYVSALLAEPPERLFKFDFDPVALRKKYDEERDKRKRSEGNDRFIWMQDDNEYSEMLKDPWMPEIKREAVQREVRCLVIGGGFSGIIAGRKLREPGIDDFVITEKGGDYAGTWYYARYPGAACVGFGWMDWMVPWLFGSFLPRLLNHILDYFDRTRNHTA